MIIYTSRTGNVEYIVKKLGLPDKKLSNNMVVDYPYILFTYTDKIGETPDVVKEFLTNNYKYLKGVICSGNSNFGVNNFCKPADDISKQFRVPILKKIELRGFDEDYKQVKMKYNEIMKGCN